MVSFLQLFSIVTFSLFSVWFSRGSIWKDCAPTLAGRTQHVPTYMMNGISIPSLTTISLEVFESKQMGYKSTEKSTYTQNM